jgi:predicted amidohydrolase
MNDLRVTFFQQDIVWGDAEANRRAVEDSLFLVPHNTDIFVVPETFTTGFGDHMAALAENPMGPTFRWAQQLASKRNFLFVGTWIVREGDKCYNRLHWIYPNGSFGWYDKAHTFRVSGEYDIISRGTQREVFEYKGWKIKPAVCYDLRFPKWLRNDNLSYDLLLVCANWPGSRHEAWTTLLKARAIENLSYVLGCNRCGKDGVGGDYTGNSALIDYKGFPVAEAEAGIEGLVSVALDKGRLDNFRERWPLYLDFD